MKTEKTKQYFAAILKHAREGAGLSQKQLADKMKIAQAQVSEIESGKLNISIETINKYAVALKLDINFSLKVKPKQPAKKQFEYCPDCDGTGWNEGGPTLQTTCDTCEGSGFKK